MWNHFKWSFANALDCTNSPRLFTTHWAAWISHPMNCRSRRIWFSRRHLGDHLVCLTRQNRRCPCLSTKYASAHDGARTLNGFLSRYSVVESGDFYYTYMVFVCNVRVTSVLLLEYVLSCTTMDSSTCPSFRTFGLKSFNQSLFSDNPGSSHSPICILVSNLPV